MAAGTTTTQSTTVLRGTLTNRGTTTRGLSVVGEEVVVRAVTSKAMMTPILAHNRQLATLRVAEVEGAVSHLETKKIEEIIPTQATINPTWVIGRTITQTHQKTTPAGVADNKNRNLCRRSRKTPQSRNSKMNGPISSAKRNKRKAMESLLTIYTSCAWPKARNPWVSCKRIQILRHQSFTKAPNLTSQRISIVDRFPKISVVCRRQKLERLLITFRRVSCLVTRKICL